MCRSIDSIEGEFEEFQRGFVGMGLLRGDDLIEVNSQLTLRAGEEIVVHIGENRKSKARLELPESGDRVGPGLPGGKRAGQRAEVFSAGSEVEFRAKLAHD